MSRGRAADLTGMVFGRLTVVERVENGPHRRSCFRCHCSCGKETVVASYRLTHGRTRSCGCLQREAVNKNLHAAWHANTTHGMRHSPEYRVWRGMHRRCKDPKHPKFHRYGGRGICVCERWHDFSAFYADVGPRPSPEHTLERINNNGHYEPGNVKWATRKEQARNRSNNHLLTTHGETLTIVEWGERTGMTKSTLRGRIKRGWSVERALSEPVRHWQRRQG